MDERQAAAKRDGGERWEPCGHHARPLVSDDERDFWRRAVAAERRRQRCGQPAPFPFQPA
jgi:hypothetical protein